MTGRSRIILVCAAILIAGACVRDALAAPPAGFELSFSDEFNGTTLDTNTWRILDSRPNVEVAGGVMDLITAEPSPGVYSEGWVDTKVFKQRFGYFESRYRIGNTTGLNNAFWINTPTEFAGADNDHDRMEIDINEGHYPSSQSRDYSVAAHDWDSGANLGLGGFSSDVGDHSLAFHTFGLEWRTDNTMVFSLDGVTKYTLAGSAIEGAFNTIPLEVIFSTKVLPGNFAGPLDPNIVGTRMSVDYVRVYDEVGFIGAVSGNWGTPENWGDADWDRTGEAALFNRATTFTTVTVAGADKQAREIVFDNASVPALTFVPRVDWPNSIIRLGLNKTAGITINEDVIASQTFNIPIVAEGNLTLSNFATSSAVNLNLNNSISGVGANRELTAYTTGNVNVNGPIASSIALVQKYQTGTLLLAGNNEYTGQTLIKQGTLAIASAIALGSATSGTIVSNDATLGLSSGFTYARAEPLQILGNGTGTRTGAVELLDSSTVSIESMPITLAGDATISNPSSTGRLRLGSVTLSAGSTLTFVGAGTTEVNGPIVGAGRFVSTGSGRVAVGTATTIAGPVKVIGGGALEIGSNAIHLQSTLDIIGAQLDMLDSAVVLNQSANNPLPTIRGLVRTGFNSGSWNGFGIMTSLSDTGLVIGFADNSVLGLTTFNGISVTSDSLLIKAVRPGDTNLDDVVDFADLLALAQHYGQSSVTWTDGDSNYDLKVDFADLLALAQNYGFGASREPIEDLPTVFRIDVEHAFAAVPEPTLLAAAGLVPFLSRRRGSSPS